MQDNACYQKDAENLLLPRETSPAPVVAAIYAEQSFSNLLNYLITSLKADILTNVVKTIQKLRGKNHKDKVMMKRLFVFEFEKSKQSRLDHKLMEM